MKSLAAFLLTFVLLLFILTMLLSGCQKATTPTGPEVAPSSETELPVDGDRRDWPSKGDKDETPKGPEIPEADTPPGPGARWRG